MDKKWVAAAFVIVALIALALAFFPPNQHAQPGQYEITLPHNGEKVWLTGTASQNTMHLSYAMPSLEVQSRTIDYWSKNTRMGTTSLLHYSDSKTEYNYSYSEAEWKTDILCIRGSCAFPIGDTDTTICYANGTYDRYNVRAVDAIGGRKNDAGAGCPI